MFEVVQKISDAPLKKCGECDGEIRRVLYPTGIIFKGSGFHINDYKKPEKKHGDGLSSDSGSKPKVAEPIK
jgi:putative FmdB family regulatory protein